MKKDNVIDLTSRMVPREEKSKSKNLKLRLDMEQAKIVVSTSLISVVLLVTLANNAMFETKPSTAHAVTMASTTENCDRCIASVSTGTSDGEDRVVKQVASVSLNETATKGHKPSEIETLAYGLLEGKYSLRTENGKLSELQFTQDAAANELPKTITDRAAFLTEHRMMLSVGFDHVIKVSESNQDGKKVETYELQNAMGMPLARVDFQLDQDNRLLSMRVASMKLAAQ